MRPFFQFIFFIVLFLLSCRNRDADKGKENNIVEIHEKVKAVVNDSTSKEPTSRLPYNISANLIYDDGTVSTFDILNDKSLALWNTIIGEGSSLKPSNSTLLKLRGNLDSMRVKIRNGKRLVIDTTILHATKDLEWIIKGTGCDRVYINITQKSVYNDTIPFACGE